MHVFLSWSGDRSKHIARALCWALTHVFHNEVKPWMSTQIAPGERWFSDLVRRLEQAHVGIICITPENLESPWMLFEAGALSKAVSSKTDVTHLSDTGVAGNVISTRVCPYLFGLEQYEFQGHPLDRFQTTIANRDGTKNLLKTINDAIKEIKPER